LFLGLALALSFCLDNAFWIDPGSASSLGAVLISRIGMQTALALIPALITVFPTGRPPGRGWWAVGVISGLAALWGLVFGLLQTTFWIDGYGSAMSPLADAIYRLNVSPHDDWALQMAEPASVVILLMVVASLGTLIARWRSADHIQPTDQVAGGGSHPGFDRHDPGRPGVWLGRTDVGLFILKGRADDDRHRDPAPRVSRRCLQPLAGLRDEPVCGRRVVLVVGGASALLGAAHRAIWPPRSGHA
jgi:hypothetical protein